MIQEANCGIGILGKEGSHAALSADYVIHRFIHLIPLMFLHGRYNYYRTSKIVFYSFYKNLIFPMPMIIFSFYSFNSGQVLYVPILMSCFFSVGFTNFHSDFDFSHL
jgi:phospholipid-translocating ATPase